VLAGILFLLFTRLAWYCVRALLHKAGSPISSNR
jgi:hypothetical protein